MLCLHLQVFKLENAPLWATMEPSEGGKIAVSLLLDIRNYLG